MVPLMLVCSKLIKLIGLVAMEEMLHAMLRKIINVQLKFIIKLEVLGDLGQLLKNVVADMNITD